MYTLLTGGAGYIGSHLSKLFLEKNRKFVIVDDLTNSDKRLLRKLEKHFCKKIPFYQIDILKKDKLQDIFTDIAILSKIKTDDGEAKITPHTLILAMENQEKTKKKYINFISDLL